jgi:hypothetical protein
MKKLDFQKNALLYLAAIALILGLVFIGFSTILSATGAVGTWQVIVDGKPSEGSFFYRADLKADGTADVYLQDGDNNIKETKNWSLQGDTVTITGDPSEKITFFTGAQMHLNSSGITYEKDGFKGDLNRHNSLSIIHFIMILVVLMLLNEIFRHNKIVAFIFFFVLPIVLIPLWGSFGITYWFKWVKLYSVVCASAWILLIRHKGLDKFKFAKLIAAMFIALNISEAVMQDFSMGNLPNILNGVAGILSIATLFYGWKGIHAESTKERDMLWPKMTIFWIIAYDIWNWVFVYLNFPGSASGQFMVIMACTIPALFIKKGTWLQARAFTLAAWFMYYFTAPRFTESMQLMIPRNATLMLIVALTSIIANAVYAIIYVGMLQKDKRTVVKA